MQPVSAQKLEVKLVVFIIIADKQKPFYETTVWQLSFYSLQGNFRSQRLWIPIHTGTDVGKGYAGTPVCFSQIQAFAVTGSKEMRFVTGAPVPYGADGMNHIGTGQVPCTGDDGLSGGAPALVFVDNTTGFEQLRPCGTMYSPIHATTAQKA
jgi:hypothetical protein